MWDRLILFRNEIKEDTRDAILELKGGNVRPVIITGDNAQCGLYIGRKSGILNSNSTVYLAEADKKGNVSWKDINAVRLGGSKATAKTVSTDEVLGWATNRGAEAMKKVELAVTGKAFDILVESGAMARLHLFTRIFARMSPEGKVTAVSVNVTQGTILIKS